MTQDLLSQKAKLVRSWCLRSTTAAGSGHPTTCLSSTDLATVLFDKYFTYDLDNPTNLNNDRIVLSKGHAAPLLYTLFALSGAFAPEELLTLRKFNSPYEGHPTPSFKYSDAATGSLGQGVSIAAGLAYIGKKENFSYKTYVFTGDGELAEGQVWEALNFASHYRLDNLIVIADINRLGQSQETMFGHQIEEYVGRFRSFGAEVIAIDGHDLKAVDEAYKEAINNKSGKPYVIVAKTFKGRGISFLEDHDNWHGKPLKEEDLQRALLELGDIDKSLRFELRNPKKSKHNEKNNFVKINADYNIGDEIATREVYGKILSQIADEDKRIYVLDAEVKNSTFSIDFLKQHPERFIECFIAEQNMTGVAVGLSRLGKKPFVSTFAAFLTRAFDQIRMAAVGNSDIAFVGSHVGVSIGEDGSSQMGLEDVAMFCTVPGSVVLCPSDAVSAAKLLPVIAGHKGISYMRTLRPKTSVIYDKSEEFRIGGSKIIKSSNKDSLLLISSGITVFEAIKAYEVLKKEGINVRIIDCYSLKPIDSENIIKSLEDLETKNIITVEDHFEHGGLGDLVLNAVSDIDAKVYKMAVRKLSHSGKMQELLDDAQISSMYLVKKVKNILQK